MYRKSELFYPRKIYLDLDFEEIKNYLKRTSLNFDDYGSLLVLKEPDLILSVNKIGKIEIFYNDVSKERINNSIDKIEDIFRGFIDDFMILH